MMYKKLLIAIVCMLTTKILVDASYYTGQPAYNINYGYQAAAQNTVRRTPAQNLANRNADALPNQPANMIEDLTEMQQIYASQPSNIEKALYISSVLDNDADNITILQKIDQAKNLLKIIDAQSALYTSWWPSSWWQTQKEKKQTEWLEDQKNKINSTIQRLNEQGNSFGINFAWKAAKLASLYLGITLLIYGAWHGTNEALKKYDPKNPYLNEPSFTKIATLPVSQFYELAKWSAINGSAAITSESAQKFLNIVKSSSHATAQNIAATAGNTAANTQQFISDHKNAFIRYLAADLMQKESSSQQRTINHSSQR